MKLLYIKKLDSTHIYIKEYVLKNQIKDNICIYSNNQENGIASRNNKWIGEEGNLFFSFIIIKKYLPIDLPLQSASIYFSYILKMTLKQLGSNAILKWPNDFYIKNDKIGGTITNMTQEYLLCGIGINLKSNTSFNGYLDIDIINSEFLLKKYFSNLEKYPSWKQIFSNYKIEFYKNKKYFTNINNELTSLDDVIINDDGSLQINYKKVFSLR